MFRLYYRLASSPHTVVLDVLTLQIRNAVAFPFLLSSTTWFSYTCPFCSHLPFLTHVFMNAHTTIIVDIDDTFPTQPSFILEHTHTEIFINLAHVMYNL